MLDIRPSDSVNVPSLATRGKGALLSDVISRDQAVLAAAEAYADLIEAAVALGTPQPGIDCSTNPNYPPASIGYFYFVDVEGKIGGASGISVLPGDLIYCLATNAGGTQAAVGASWHVTHMGLTGAALLGAGNTFTEVQTILKNVAGALLILDSNDSGAFSGPNFRGLRRKSSGVIGGLTENAYDDAAAEQTYAALRARIVAAAAGAFEGAWDLQTAVGGAVGTRVSVGRGVYSPLADDGDMGADTANFKRYYEDGVSAEVAGAMRGYDFTYDAGKPTIEVGVLSNPRWGVWNFRSTDSDTTPPDADPHTYATMSVSRYTAGIGADGPGNTERALIIIGSRGQDQDFRDSVVLGQHNGAAIYLRVPQVSSHAGLLMDVRRAISEITGDLGLSGSDDGGVTLFEANLQLVAPADGTPLLNLGVFVGHHENPTNDTWFANKAYGFRTQLSTTSVGYGVYATILHEDNVPATSGIEWIVAAHKQVDEAPYFGITGWGDEDAPGRVLATRNTDETLPPLAFMEDPGTGLGNPSAGILAITADGVVCATAQAGYFVFPSYTVSAANALIKVPGGVIRVSNQAGGATLAQCIGSNWKVIASPDTIST